MHAGIAASDAICCQELGHHVVGARHEDAIDELAKVKPDGRALALALSNLLAMKSRAGYAAQPVRAADRTRARRNAERLLLVARARL
ncbi:MAG: hypothetical protein M3141_07495 [Actinomycetota bacterium]|nr:hypothetical protein [Actinomycetota bacterium]